MTLEDMDTLFHSHAAHDEVVAKREIVAAIVGALNTTRPASNIDDNKDGGQVWIEKV